MAKSYNELTVAQLKELLTSRNVEKPLPTKKAELIKKLHAIDVAEAEKLDEELEDDNKSSGNQSDVAAEEVEQLLAEPADGGDKMEEDGEEKSEEQKEDDKEANENGDEEKMEEGKEEEAEAEAEEEEEEEEEDPKMQEKLRRRAVPYDLVKTKVDRIREVRYRTLLLYPVSFDDLTSFWLQQALGKAQQFFVRFFEHDASKCTKGSVELRMTTREEAQEVSKSLAEKKEDLTVKLLDPNSTIDQTLQEMRGVTENLGTNLAKRLLVVEDLPYTVKDESLKTAFPEASYILRPRRNDGLLTRYCYVEYETQEKCQEVDKELLEKDVTIEDNEVFVRPVWQELTENDVEGLIDMSEKEEMRVRIQTMRGDRVDALAEDDADRAYNLGKMISRVQARLHKDSQIRIKMCREEQSRRDAKQAATEKKGEKGNEKKNLKRPRQTSTSEHASKFSRTSKPTSTTSGAYKRQGSGSGRGGGGGYNQSRGGGFKTGGYSQPRGSFNRGGGGAGGYGGGGGYQNQGGYSRGGAGPSGYGYGGQNQGGYHNAGLLHAPQPNEDVAAVKGLLHDLKQMLHPGQRAPAPAPASIDYPPQPRGGALRNRYEEPYREDPYNVESGYAPRRPAQAYGRGGGGGGRGYGRY